MTLQSLQWRSSTVLSRITNMGPCNRAQTKCTIHNTWEGIPTDTRQTESTTGLCKRTTGERIHLSFKEPICGTLLLHQKERWQATASPRLLMTQWVDHQEPLPTAVNLRTNCTSPKCKTIYQVWCQMGVQQYTHQERSQAQSSVYHKPRTVWTYCYILWANKLSSNIPDNDLHSRNSQGMANHLHGWYTHCYQRWPKIPWRMCPPHTRKTMPTQPIPQTSEVHLWKAKNGIFRSSPRRQDGANGPS